jgi:hypothetical protein
MHFRLKPSSFGRWLQPVRCLVRVEPCWRKEAQWVVRAGAPGGSGGSPRSGCAAERQKPRRSRVLQDSVQAVQNPGGCRSPALRRRLSEVLAVSQADRSAGLWKSSRATPAEKAAPTARASSCSSGRAWIWAVLASERGPQRRLRRRRVTLASPRASPSWRPLASPSASQSCTARVWRKLLHGNAGNHHDLLLAQLGKPLVCGASSGCEIAKNFLGQNFVDFPVPGHRLGTPG